MTKKLVIDKTTWDIRNEILPLPNKDNGFSTALLIGTTGSGKTTLLRQIIGTDPVTERFPSTSTNKTTTCDYEIICDPDCEVFSAVVTFLSEKNVEGLVQESVTNSIISFIENKNEKELMRKFLEHSEQRFRLKYLIGNYHQSDEDDFENEIDEDAENDEDTEINNNSNQINEKLNKYCMIIKSISDSVSDKTSTDLGESQFEKIDKNSRDSFLELCEEEIMKNNDFYRLVEDVMSDIKSKLNLVESGSFMKNDFDWPVYWNIEENDRGDFIETITYFSSNNSNKFGSLLTPLVDGVRVRGAFSTLAKKSVSKLVLIDGEGLGHNPKDDVLSSKLSNKLSISDVIVLVDNSQQPMQASTIAALKHIINRGNLWKLVIAFTHFELLKGDNFGNKTDKQEHLINSLDNAISSFNDNNLSLTQFNEHKKENIFYFSKIDKKYDDSNKVLTKELSLFLDALCNKIIPKNIDEIKLIFNDKDLKIYIDKSINEFFCMWQSRLGEISYSNYSKEHWTRIKALTRRLGEFNIDEYDYLKPVSELFSFVIDNITIFLYKNHKSDPITATDKQKSIIISSIQSTFADYVYSLISDSLHKSRIEQWFRAYQFRGSGSTISRANSILSIYADTTLKDSDFNDSEFNQEIREILYMSIKDNNCEII